MLQVAISRPRARARTLEPEALRQVERHEGGAFGERFKRPWEEQWAKGAEVSVNLHWWSRPSDATAVVFGTDDRRRTRKGLAEV